LGSTSCDRSFHDDDITKVFSISSPLEVGKINNDMRNRKKKVAKTTIMNIATIIKIKIQIVFTLIIPKLHNNKEPNNILSKNNLRSRLPNDNESEK
jgi:hypothetical protein